MVTVTAVIPATFGEIQAQFAAARHSTASWDALIDIFHWVDVEIQPELRDGFANSMAFLVSMRGALGLHLHETCLVATQDTDNDQCSAARLMFHSMGQIAKGFEYPKPYVLQFDTDPAVFRVRLFGPAMAFAVEISAILMRIAAQLKNNPFGQPVKITGRRIATGSIVKAVNEDTKSRLDFLTPLAMRQGQEMQDAPTAVLRGVLRRASGVLAWYGLGLPQPFSEVQDRLALQFKLAHWEARSERSEAWFHPSSRQKRRFREFGTRGVLALGASVGDVYGLFKLGEAVHAGSKTTIGCGRFRLSN